MRLLIFGATGKTGKEIVKQGIANGYDVTAFVRNANSLDETYGKLNVIEGDALDYSAVNGAVQNHDAVVCALGMPSLMDRSQLRTKATKNIVAAMTAWNINRLICLSAFGAGDSFSHMPKHYRYLISPLLMRNLYRDHNGQEKIVRESKLVWTIVRPAILVDGAITGHYWHGVDPANKSLKNRIARADVAEFMLDQISEKNYIYQTPLISYRN